MSNRVKTITFCLLTAIIFMGSQLLPLARTQPQSSSVNVCGTVTAYTAATAALSGLITCGGQSFPIAPGVSLVNASLISIGANVCLSATLNLLGQISAGTVTSNVTTTVNVCGVVGAFVGATASSTGSITINGQTFVIASGTTINGQSLVSAGVNACLSATLNASGQIVAPSSITVSATTTVNVCGVVSAFASATASAPGSITINGQNFVITAGTTLNGQALITTGVNACLSATLNASGQIVAPSSITVNATSTVNVCGVVSAFAAATASSPGSITINGQNFVITAGTALDGQALITTGVNACLSATLNASGQIMAPSTITVNAGATVNVCGVVSALVAATASAPGSITINGQSFVITAGTTINGQSLVTAGVNACLSATLNASGQIIAPSSITVNATTTVNVCGVVTAFVAATASAPGSITCGGQSFVITAGTTITGQGMITSGVNACLSATLNASGQIIPPSSVTVNATSTINVCGVVSAFGAATASAPGSITINGQNFVITAGTTINGQAQIVVGLTMCLSATLNASGQVIPPSSITVSATSTINVCGVVSAFLAASANSPGSITINGQTFVIAAGTTINGQGQISIGVNACLSATVNVGGQIIPPATIVVNPPSGGNHSPTISVPGPQIIEAGKTLMFTVTGSDQDTGDIVTLTSSGVPANASFNPGTPGNPVTGTFSFSPANNQIGQVFVVSFTATDNKGASATGSVPIIVIGPAAGQKPGPPTISVPPSPIIIEVGTTLAFMVTGTSPVQGCPVGLSASGVPEHATFEPSTGKFTFTPVSDQKDKSFLVTFTATDCTGQSVIAGVTIIVVEASAGAISKPGQICVPVTKVFFGSTPVSGGCATFVSISLVNKGVGALRLESISLLEGKHFRVDGVAGLPVTLQSAGVVLLKVSFEPKDAGTLTDVLTIATSDPENPTVTIALRGKAVK